jgi:hypothetical protein
MTRIEAHKKEAECRQGTLMPFAAKQVQKMDEAAVEFSQVVELISPTWIKVYSCGSAKVSYDVNGDDCMHCSCNKSVVETEPCNHEQDAARALGKCIDDFYNEKDKMDTWREQYSVVNEDIYVSLNEVYQEYLGPHVLPVVYKKPKGCPKHDKRKKSAFKLASLKAKMSTVQKIQMVAV